MAGTQYARITPEGNVTPCPYMTAVAGNVRERSFAEIWNDSPVLTELRDTSRLGGRCGRCEFAKMCGGCRCRAYAATQDYLAEDPACTYQPTGVPLAEPDVAWSGEALARLERIPIAFVREKARRGVEAYARRKRVTVIEPKTMQEALAGQGRMPAFAKLPMLAKSDKRHQ